MQQDREDRSLGELFADLSHEMSSMVRQEVAIAKTEMTQKAFQVGRYVGFLAVGGALGYAGLLALIAALIITLRKIGLAWWLSALLVGSMVAGVGAFLIWKGLDALQREDLVPRQTIETLKEDQEWAKEQMR
jgi:hypothetical protein